MRVEASGRDTLILSIPVSTITLALLPLAAKRQGEAIQAARRRAVQVLTINVIMRAVTWALEAHAVVAERHGAAEMDAALVEREPSNYRPSL